MGSVITALWSRIATMSGMSVFPSTFTSLGSCATVQPLDVNLSDTIPHNPSCLVIMYPFMAGHWPDICPIVSGANRHLPQVVSAVFPALAKVTLLGYVSVRNFSPVMKSPSSK